MFRRCASLPRRSVLTPDEPVIYRIEDADHTIRVLTVDYRSDVYRLN